MRGRLWQQPKTFSVVAGLLLLKPPHSGTNGCVIDSYTLKAFQSLILQQWRACLCYHSNGAEYDVKFCSGASCAWYLLIEESGKHGGNHNGNQSNPTRRA